MALENAIGTIFAIEIPIPVPIYTYITPGTLVYPTLTLMVKMVKWQCQNVKLRLPRKSRRREGIMVLGCHKRDVTCDNKKKNKKKHRLVGRPPSALHKAIPDKSGLP